MPWSPPCDDSANKPALCTGKHWARQVVERGTADDVHALASAVALSERATHPVSKAAAALGKAAGGQLPSLHIEDFKLVPGKRADNSLLCLWHYA